MKSFSIVLLSLSLFACGGAAVTATTPPLEVSVPAAPEPGPLDYMSTDVFAVVTVDVARGLESPFFPTIRDAIHQMARANPRENVSPEDVDAALALLNDTQTITVGFGKSGRDEFATVFIEGSLSLDQLRSGVRLLDENVSIVESQVGGMAGLLIDDEALIVEVGPGRFLAGLAERVRHTLATPPTNSLAQSAEFMAAHRLLPEDVAVRLVSANPVVLDSGFEGITGAAITLDAPAGAHYRIHATTDTAERATGLVAEVEQMRAQILQQMGPMLGQGLDVTLNEAEIRADGSDIYASVDMTEAQVRAILNLIVGMM